ncbi:MAG: diaminopimelate epimerase [Streptosporangiales bacterium]
MRFAKGHGTENDFVILPDPAGEFGLPAGLAARLCDRRAGIGADGVLRVVRTAVLPGGDAPAASPASPAIDPASAAEWFMDYRNADGSIAEMCGNGVRVFARYLLDHGLVTGPAFAVATRGGVRQVRAGADGQITVDMGPVTILGAGRAAVGGLDRDGLRISVGNPHLACLVDDPLDKYDLAEVPVLDPAEFPDGGNVELVRLAGPGAITMRVHERGSGETRSCGTGAVAAAAAAQCWPGGDTPGQEQIWQVHVPGGELTVTLGARTTWLTGPAVIVAEGELDPRWLAATG